MPLYEYKCGDCGNVFEELVGKTVPDNMPLCPKCGSDNCQKLFSTFATAVGGKSSMPSCPAAGKGCAGAGGGGGGFT
ncbi:MAG: zinc ribbon domain-containing protein [FCB group bacterium]|nr:zinc ribbon domain-containing protein [FCB group bacterium]